MAYIATIASMQIAATYTCQSSGALNFSSAASVVGGGDSAWVNPTYALTTESPTPLFAVSTLSKGGSKKSYYLQVSNLGLAVSSHQKVTGIQVSVTRKAGSINSIKDILCKLINADSTFGSTNKADTSTFWPSSSTAKTYGGEGDTWGETLSGADLNDTDFGFVIQCQNYNAPSIVAASIEVITMTIWFTGGARMTVTKTISV